MRNIELIKKWVEFTFDPDMMAYYFMLGGKRRTIRGIFKGKYEQKHSTERKKTAAVIRILRKNDFLFTDLLGKTDSHPVVYFSNFQEEGFVIRQVSHDDHVRCNKADDNFSDIHGVAFDKDGNKRDFFFRIYSVDVYEEAMRALQPLLKGLIEINNDGLITLRQPD